LLFGEQLFVRRRILRSVNFMGRQLH